MRVSLFVKVVLGKLLMPSDEKKEEITVKAPSRPIIPPEKRAEKTAERALEEERYGVLQVPKKIGKYIGAVSLGTGILLIGLLMYAIFSDQTDLIFLSLGSSLPIVGLWIFVGLISIVIGFLLMGSE
jgi:hypothetical protein